MQSPTNLRPILAKEEEGGNNAEITKEETSFSTTRKQIKPTTAERTINLHYALVI